MAGISGPPAPTYRNLISTKLPTVMRGRAAFCLPIMLAPPTSAHLPSRFNSSSTGIVMAALTKRLDPAVAMMAAIYRVAVLLAGHDYCHRGKDALVIAGILALLAIIPESAGKPKPEKCHLT